MKMEIDPLAFRDVSYGVYIVSSTSDGKKNGQIANAIVQVTSSPPQFAVCINKSNLTHEYICSSNAFGVSILEDAADIDFIAKWGFKSGRQVDKFDKMDYKHGPLGTALVTSFATSIIEAKVINSVDAGTHTIFIGEVVYSEQIKSAQLLTYHDYHTKKKGKTPKSAPTYTDESGISEGAHKAKNSYGCSICGYVYNPDNGDPASGITKSTAFDELPDTWKCPWCGADKSKFLCLNKNMG
ncbi:MAG: flavin reductase [Oligoflexales bacterium]|nr:flavin reductase [Oligoflexales bacterium]